TPTRRPAWLPTRPLGVYGEVSRSVLPGAGRSRPSIGVPTLRRLPPPAVSRWWKARPLDQSRQARCDACCQHVNVGQNGPNGRRNRATRDGLVRSLGGRWFHRELGEEVPPLFGVAGLGQDVVTARDQLARRGEVAAAPGGGVADR